MRTAGVVLLILGFVIAAIAAMMETTVPTGASSLAGYGVNLPSSVTNLAKQQTQLLAFTTGGVFFLAGIVLVGMGELQATMIERSRGIARLLKKLDPAHVPAGGYEVASESDAVAPVPPVAPASDPIADAARDEERARLAAQSDRWVKYTAAAVGLLAIAVVALMLLG